MAIGACRGRVQMWCVETGEKGVGGWGSRVVAIAMGFGVVELAQYERFFSFERVEAMGGHQPGSVA